MKPSQWKLLFLFSLLSLIHACTMLRHGDDPNYTLCKTIENKLVFQDNSTLFSTNPTSTYSQTAVEYGNDDQKLRLQKTYDRLGCSRYEAIKF